MNTQPSYVSFLLRLWRIPDGDDAVWRASLEDTLSGEQMAFATVENLLEFLQRWEKSSCGFPEERHDKGAANGSEPIAGFDRTSHWVRKPFKRKR